MNFGGNAALDQAELRAEQERETSIAAASAAVSVRGALICQDCPSKISDERRAAAPFARRCIECQEFHEMEKRHR
ncbi:phage/conjugal plasmid C-4 type zinc finger TraR family protein [Rhizobium skierniewicense]|uniref:Phage/conjugal plasmid C-4 type zinc finger TraR family protein n=1 Tax=Rhizobium skierniewicense TaxID=984260 RepID=A0A7W6CBB8_9HYPH|nr:TraR/DksA C4-type zinc finger protein [Rhizobium skierniewicense]MBB3947233.1 phage/conjugal plasmid C-4 type zinc finger TraR family protein [Rhizobium skierniewicense]